MGHISGFIINHMEKPPWLKQERFTMHFIDELRDTYDAEAADESPSRSWRKPRPTRSLS